MRFAKQRAVFRATEISVAFDDGFNVHRHIWRSDGCDESQWQMLERVFGVQLAGLVLRGRNARAELIAGGDSCATR